MALPISGTYNFQSISVETIIIEAFEQVGFPRYMLEPEKLQSALRSLNLIMTEWMNQGVNLWTLQLDYLSLTAGQNFYELPNYISNITQINTRQFARQLNGTADSSSGDADNAFDGNLYTSCQQDAPNGYISYEYSADGSTTQLITFIGITSADNLEYTLEVLGTTPPFDPAPAQDITIMRIPKQLYPQGITKWFDITGITNQPLSSISIRETGGATLNIAELYFTNNTTDIAMSNISRDEYLTFPMKNIMSRPSSFYVDRQYVNPTLRVFPAPSSSYPVLQYSYKTMLQDAVKYTDSIEIPSRFYAPMVAALAQKLAIKAQGLGITIGPEKLSILQMEADKLFSLASREDSESIPMGFDLDLSKYA